MKKLYVVASFLVVFTAGLLWMRRPAQAQTTTDEPYYTFPIDDVIMGYKISPVPITIGNRNPFRVGWGSYLVNAVAGCNDCHTNPAFADGGDPTRASRKRSMRRRTSVVASNSDRSPRET